MPARDAFHEQLKRALLRDGWEITHDPLHLKWGAKDMYVDLGAREILAAEKSGRKIGVEIKSFTGPSEMRELEQALGQYMIYADVLEHTEPERMLYLAVPDEIFSDLFEEPIGRLIIEKHTIRLIVFDPVAEVIVQWIQ
jgi:hypothetical protein